MKTNKIFLFVLLTALVLTTTYGIIEIRRAEVVARDYKVNEIAYFNNRHTTYFFLLNVGNEPTNILDVNLQNYDLPHNCFPTELPPIKPAYVLQYYCTSDIIMCSDRTRFHYSPSFEYVEYTHEERNWTRVVDLPRKSVNILSPLQLTDMKNVSHLELTLDRGYRLHLNLENKGLTSVTANFELIVPGYTLLEIHTVNGTILPEEISDYTVDVAPLQEIPLTFYLIPKYPGVGEKLIIRVYDKMDPCVDAIFTWEVTVWAVFGRLVRVLTSTDFLSVLILLSIVLLFINKDKLFKK